MTNHKTKADKLSHGARLKIQRAEDHINDLGTRIDAFLAERPFKLMKVTKRQAGRIEFVVEFEKPIPEEFSLIAGDTIHNLAAALDFTMYSLAAPRSPSLWEIAFPFPRQEKGLEGAINKGQVIFAGSKVVEAVKRLKPYPDGHPILNGIHQLDTRDKHRLLLLSRYVPFLNAKVIGKLVGKYTPGATYSGDGGILYMGPEDKPILSISVRFATALMASSKQEAAVQPSFNIAFGEGQPFHGEPLLSKLNEMVDAVKEAVGVS